MRWCVLGLSLLTACGWVGQTPEGSEERPRDIVEQRLPPAREEEVPGPPTASVAAYPDHLVQGGEPFSVARPASIEEAIEVMRTAAEARRPIRIVGRRHSTSGRNLPLDGEVLIETSGLREVRRVAPDAIRAGAGISVHRLDAFLRGHGLALRVRNAGEHGPSVGGYVSTGGFGPGSALHGGLWEQVREVRIVDGTGTLRVLTPKDAQFAYLFGSTGQLGLITDAVLAVDVVDPSKGWAVGSVDVAPPDGDEQPPVQGAAAGAEYLWTLIVPAERQAEAEAGLEALTAGLDTLAWGLRYRFPIAHLTVDAPLVAPVGVDAVVVGVGGVPKAGDPAGRLAQALAADEVIRRWAVREGLRQYLTHELRHGPEVYRAQWGDEIYGRFLAIKDEFDPYHLVNRGVVFAPPEPAR